MYNTQQTVKELIKTSETMRTSKATPDALASDSCFVGCARDNKLIYGTSNFTFYAPRLSRLASIAFLRGAVAAAAAAAAAAPCVLSHCIVEHTFGARENQFYLSSCAVSFLLAAFSINTYNVARASKRAHLYIRFAPRG